MCERERERKRVYSVCQIMFLRLTSAITLNVLKKLLKKKKKKTKKDNNTFLKLTSLIIELTHDTFARFSASFYKQVHFCDSLFAFLHYKSLLQRGILCSGWVGGGGVGGGVI